MERAQPFSDLRIQTRNMSVKVQQAKHVLTVPRELGIQTRTCYEETLAHTNTSVDATLFLQNTHFGFQLCHQGARFRYTGTGTDLCLPMD